MALPEKALAAEHNDLREQDPDGRRREPSPTSGALLAMCALCRVYTHRQTRRQTRVYTHRYGDRRVYIHRYTWRQTRVYTHRHGDRHARDRDTHTHMHKDTHTQT